MPVAWSSSSPAQPWMSDGRLRTVSGSERKPDGRSASVSRAGASRLLDVGSLDDGVCDAFGDDDADGLGEDEEAETGFAAAAPEPEPEPPDPPQPLSAETSKAAVTAVRPKPRERICRPFET